MADNIDEKVVSMRFDNKQFEKGVDETLKSIQELKNSLNFEESVKSLDNLSKAGKRFNFDGVSEAIDTVRVKFSAFEVAVNTTIERVVNNALSAAKRMASAFTIDPIKAGFGVYEQKMDSVMTIMNNSGKSLGEVNEILQSLNDYSDRTIYSLNDMTTALGKFTAAGIDATEAVDIIKGAANEAATMGADAASFSRFIYNLSQAYSVGKMTMIDWKSLENAGIAGVKFKQTLVDAARELGTINDEFEKKHGIVTATNLREFLKEGIITNEVMTKAFKLYSDTSTDFGKAAQNAAQQVKTFHQLLDVLKESVASQWSQTWTYIIGDFNEARKLWTAVSHMFDETIGKMVANKKELFRLWHEGFIDPETNQQISGRMMLIDGLANLLQTFLQIAKPVKDAFREIFPAKTAENLWEATKAFRDFTNQLRLSETTMQNIKDFASGIFSVMKTVRTVFKDLLAAIFPATAGVDSLLQIVLALAGALGRFLTRVTTAIRESEEYQTILRGIGQAVLVIIKMVAVLGKTLFNIGKVAKDTGILQKALGFIANVLVKIVSAVMTYGPKVLAILGAIGQVVAGIVGLVAGGIGSGINFFKNLFSKKDGNEAAKAVGEVTKSMSSLTKADVQEDGENVTKGFGVGLMSGLSSLMDIVRRIFGGVITTVEKLFGIESPSKVFIAIGGFILAGLLIGLTNPTIRGQISDALSDFAENGIVQFFKNALSKAFNGIANVWAGAVQGISGLITRVSENLQGLGAETDTLAGKIGRFFSGLINGLREVNGAAILLTAIVGTALVGVIKLLSTIVNITGFLSEAGSGFRNITKSFVNTTKAFKAMAKAFMRQQNPIVATLRGIAFSILAITTALLVLSTVEDKNSLWTSAAVLAGSLLAIVALLTAAAQRIKTGHLTEAVDQISKMLIMAAASIAILTLSFSLMAQIMADSENSVGVIFAALGGMVAVTAIMGILIAKLSAIPFNSSLKAAGMMLTFAIVLGTVTRSLKKLANLNDTEGVLGVAASLATLMAAIGFVTFAASNISWGGMAALLSVAVVLRTVVYAIQEVNWASVLKTIEDNYMVVIAIMGVVAVLTIGATLMGSAIQKFGQGMRDLGFAILAMAAAVAVMKYLKVGVVDILRLVGVLTELVGLYSVIMLISHYAKIPKRSLKELANIMKALGLVIVEMALAAGIAAKLDADGGTIAGVGIAIAAFMGGIALILSQIKNARGDSDLKDLSKLIKAFVWPLLGLALLTKVYSGSSAGDIAAVILTIVGIFTGIGVLCTLVGNIKEEQVKFMNKVVTMLVAAIVGLTVLSMIPYQKLLLSMAALTSVLLSLFLIFKGAAGLKAENTKPLIAAVAALVVVGASLGVLATLCDWQDLLAASGAMAITLLAVAGALAAVSSFEGKAIKGALGLVLASASLIVIGYSLENFVSIVEWDTVLQACVSLLAVAGSLAAVSAFGAKAIAGSFALVIASASLLIIGEAMQKFNDVDWGAGVGKMAASLGILTAFIAVFGLFSTIAIPGSMGLIMASVGLIAVAKAMQMFSETSVGGGYLAGIAGGLMLIGIAGVILTAGAAGLIAGGLGLIVVAGALRIMSGIDTKIVNGSTLSGIAGGLMLIGLAGVVLGLGGTGLLIGGVGLIVLSGALALMDDLNYKQLSKKNLTDLAKGLMQMALVGVIGVVAGPGLIALATGLTALIGVLTLFTGALEGIIDTMTAFGDTDAVGIGSNIIAGMIKGVVGMTGALMSTVSNIFTGFIGGICNILGIHSPSERMRQIGQFTGLGFLEGWADSDIMKKLDEVSASIAQNHVIAPFVETLSNGFGNIGDILNGIDIFGNKNAEIEEQIKKEEEHIHQLTTKMRIARANGNTGLQASLSKDIGRAEVRIAKLKEQLKADNLFGDLTEGWDSIFSGLQGGLEGLTDNWLPDLDDILAEIGTEMGGTTLDANALAGGLEEVSAASATTTQRFGENINMLSAFDRSLKTTVNNIEKDMIDRLLGTDQWNKYLMNMKSLGYDPALVKEIADMGMDSGYAYAAAFVRAGQNASKKDEINRLFRLGQTSKTELADWYKLLELEAEANKEGVRNIDNYLATEADLNGEADMIADSIERDADVSAKIYDATEKSLHNQSMFDLLKQLGVQLSDGTKEANAAAERYQQAQANADASAADYAMSYMADAIKGAITKYLPPEEFAVIGQNVCLGFGAGIMSYASWPIEKTEQFAQSVIDAFCKVTKVQSPSKVFRSIGEYLVEGLSLGLEDTSEAEKATADLGKGVIDMMMDELARIQKAIEGDELWQPTIRPVVDFSNIQAGADNAQMIFDRMNIDAAAREFANFKVATSSPANTMAGMSKDEFARFLQGFANVIVDGINNGEKTITVPITIKNDPYKQFEATVDINNEYKRTNGYSAFV